MFNIWVTLPINLPTMHCYGHHTFFIAELWYEAYSGENLKNNERLIGINTSKVTLKQYRQKCLSIQHVELYSAIGNVLSAGMESKLKQSLH